MSHSTTRLLSLLLALLVSIQTAIAAPVLMPVHAIPFNSSAIFTIPNELMQLDDSGVIAERPTLFHILDAHGHQEAQTKIAATLEYLYKNHGIRKFFLEGASIELDANALTSLRGDLLQAEMTAKLEANSLLSGAESFFLNHPDENISIEGIEKTSLYRASTILFRSLIRQSESHQAYFKLINSLLEDAQKKLSSGPLQKFFQSWMMFLTTGETETLLPQIKELSLRHLGLDLTHPSSNELYPSLLRLFTLQRLGEEVDQGGFAKEKMRFVESFSSFLSSEQKATVENLQTRVPEANEFDARLFSEALLEDLQAQGLQYSDYPLLSHVLGNHALGYELNSPSLTEEMRGLTTKLLRQLSNDQGDHLLISVHLRWIQLQEMLRLTLKPQDWSDIQEGGVGYLNDWLRDFAELMGKDSTSHNAFLKPLFAKSRLFYRLSMARDQVFLKKINAFLNQSTDTQAVLITGGFHAPHLKKFITAKNISYLKLTPKIGLEASSRELYLQSMLGADTDQSNLMSLALLETPLPSARRMIGQPYVDQRLKSIRSILFQGSSVSLVSKNTAASLGADSLHLSAKSTLYLGSDLAVYIDLIERSKASGFVIYKPDTLQETKIPFNLNALEEILSLPATQAKLKLIDTTPGQAHFKLLDAPDDLSMTILDQTWVMSVAKGRAFEFSPGAFVDVNQHYRITHLASSENRSTIQIAKLEDGAVMPIITKSLRLKDTLTYFSEAGYLRIITSMVGPNTRLVIADFSEDRVRVSNVARRVNDRAVQEFHEEDVMSLKDVGLLRLVYVDLVNHRVTLRIPNQSYLVDLKLDSSVDLLNAELRPIGSMKLLGIGFANRSDEPSAILQFNTPLAQQMTFSPSAKSLGDQETPEIRFNANSTYVRHTPNRSELVFSLNPGQTKYLSDQMTVTIVSEDPVTHAKKFIIGVFSGHKREWQALPLPNNGILGERQAFEFDLPKGGRVILRNTADGEITLIIPKSTRVLDDRNSIPKALLDELLEKSVESRQAMILSERLFPPKTELPNHSKMPLVFQPGYSRLIADRWTLSLIGQDPVTKSSLFLLGELTGAERIWQAIPLPNGGLLAKDEVLVLPLENEIVSLRSTKNPHGFKISLPRAFSINHLETSPDLLLQALENNSQPVFLSNIYPHLDHDENFTSLDLVENTAYRVQFGDTRELFFRYEWRGKRLFLEIESPRQEILRQEIKLPGGLKVPMHGFIWPQKDTFEQIWLTREENIFRLNVRSHEAVQISALPSAGSLGRVFTMSAKADHPDSVLRIGDYLELRASGLFKDELDGDKVKAQLTVFTPNLTLYGQDPVHAYLGVGETLDLGMIGSVKIDAIDEKAQALKLSANIEPSLGLALASNSSGYFPKPTINGALMDGLATSREHGKVFFLKYTDATSQEHRLFFRLTKISQDASGPFAWVSYGTTFNGISGYLKIRTYDTVFLNQFDDAFPESASMAFFFSGHDGRLFRLKTLISAPRSVFVGRDDFLSDSSNGSTYASTVSFSVPQLRNQITVPDNWETTKYVLSRGKDQTKTIHSGPLVISLRIIGRPGKDGKINAFFWIGAKGEVILNRPFKTSLKPGESIRLNQNTLLTLQSIDARNRQVTVLLKKAPPVEKNNSPVETFKSIQMGALVRLTPRSKGQTKAFYLALLDINTDWAGSYYVIATFADKKDFSGGEIYRPGDTINLPPDWRNQGEIRITNSDGTSITLALEFPQGSVQAKQILPFPDVARDTSSGSSLGFPLAETFSPEIQNEVIRNVTFSIARPGIVLHKESLQAQLRSAERIALARLKAGKLNALIEEFSRTPNFSTTTDIPLAKTPNLPRTIYLQTALFSEDLDDGLLSMPSTSDDLVKAKILVNHSHPQDSWVLIWDSVIKPPFVAVFKNLRKQLQPGSTTVDLNSPLLTLAQAKDANALEPIAILDPMQTLNGLPDKTISIRLDSAFLSQIDLDPAFAVALLRDLADHPASLLQFLSQFGTLQADGSTLLSKGFLDAVLQANNAYQAIRKSA